MWAAFTMLCKLFAYNEGHIVIMQTYPKSPGHVKYILEYILVYI